MGVHVLQDKRIFELGLQRKNREKRKHTIEAMNVNKGSFVSMRKKFR